ncbi:choline kinase family protein [Oribacterium sp. NK2B42]|uniref:choline kinase family protein n=1 Tax=Oribacterium sp. NK2B42 TaxID=689781 RepID=UPI0003F91D23|nr:choline kinase family protein [Oribacterium sp. NK2B42]
MADLIRKIEKDDIPKLKELLFTALGDSTYADIERLGGMTNHSYKITKNDGQEYLVRLPGEGTEEMINRLDERKSTELACKLDIDSPLLFFDDNGRKVMRFIHNPQPMNEEVMRREENLLQAADIFRRLHTCGEDTGVRFEVFEMADLYERIIQKAGTAFYQDYADVRQTVMNIKAEVDAENDIRKVPCHNDSLMGNWVLDGDGRLYLIDWEYSGMNEYMWDLSCLSIEADYAAEDDERLLCAYYGRPSTVKEKKYLIAAKLYVDYLWTLWGLTRVPFDGQYMQEYADMRYERLKRNIEKYGRIR